jgi:hypothetical protein
VLFDVDGTLTPARQVSTLTATSPSHLSRDPHVQKDQKAL